MALFSLGTTRPIDADYGDKCTYTTGDATGSWKRGTTEGVGGYVVEPTGEVSVNAPTEKDVEVMRRLVEDHINKTYTKGMSDTVVGPLAVRGFSTTGVVSLNQPITAKVYGINVVIEPNTDGSIHMSVATFAELVARIGAANVKSAGNQCLTR